MSRVRTVTGISALRPELTVYTHGRWQKHPRQRGSRGLGGAVQEATTSHAASGGTAASRERVEQRERQAQPERAAKPPESGVGYSGAPRLL
jgi:hypothetical protein